MAHVVSHELSNGPVPEGQIVRHTCDVRGCINPEHLILGTKKDNQRDFMERHPRAREIVRAAALNAAKGSKNRWAKLTPEEREQFCRERSRKQSEIRAQRKAQGNG